MITHISGTIDRSHNKQHIPHTFELPEGTTKLTIRFDFSPAIAEGAEHTNQLSFSLFDPNQSRGTRHNNKEQQAILTPGAASPGFTAGPLPAGTWTIFLDTHRIMPPTPIDYEFAIEIEAGGALETNGVIEPAPTWTKGRTASRGSGWYRGDLHGHTLHSDGKWDVAEFIAYARAHQYDFVTLTDHNTVSALPEWDSHCSDDLLTMGGMELTTYYGHALALGTRKWWEWRTDVSGTMTDYAQQITAAGALFVIAHPRDLGDPYCTGCRWEYEEMMPGIATVVEVWNGPWSHLNEDSLALAYEWLNAGYRMAFTFGSDIHGPPSRSQETPIFNVVYADDLSEGAILQAIRQGHSYLTAGPVLSFTATDGENEYMMGDAVAVKTAAQVELTCMWSGCPKGAIVRVIENGEVAQERAVGNQGSETITRPVERGWFTVEIRDAEGKLLAIANPIFMQPR